MKSMKNKYWKTKKYHILLLLVLTGCFNWGTTALGYNFVEIIKNLLNKTLKMETYIDKIIYILFFSFCMGFTFFVSISS